MKERIIITVVGKDRVGILAKVCTYLAANSINILDITQTIVQGIFNMMMIAETSEETGAFSQAQKELSQIGEELGVQILCQKEEIFEKMHRI